MKSIVDGQNSMYHLQREVGVTFSLRKHKHGPLSMNPRPFWNGCKWIRTRIVTERESGCGVATDAARQRSTRLDQQNFFQRNDDTTQSRPMAPSD